MHILPLCLIASIAALPLFGIELAISEGLAEGQYQTVGFDRDLDC